jgi:transcription-repair coupling factor (superfamily II helicase)
MKLNFKTFKAGEKILFSNVPDGLEGLILAQLAYASGNEGCIFVARDGQRAAMMQSALQFFAPQLEVIHFPSWDCQPYDRVSPNTDVVARRITALSKAVSRKNETPFAFITSVNAVLQKIPPVEELREKVMTLKSGHNISMDALTAYLEKNGYLRTPTVRTIGEYAVRGGILDVYSPGLETPVRLDFFGNTLESVRSFDAETQRTIAQIKTVSLSPMSEITIDENSIRLFRKNYTSHFGVPRKDDALYAAVSEGRRHIGMEHWLGFFHEEMTSLFDVLPSAPVLFDALVSEAFDERWKQIEDYYEARESLLEKAAGQENYKPAPPDTLYLNNEAYKAAISSHAQGEMTPFAVPDGGRKVIDLKAQKGRSFAAERASGDVNIFDAVLAHASTKRKEGKTVLIAAWTQGSRDRLQDVLKDHGLLNTIKIEDWSGIERLKPQETGFVIFPLENGLETENVCIIAEQDILGDRMVRTNKKRKRAADVLTETSSLAEGDYVVHVDHGIGQFIGLKTITVGVAPHDCLELLYHGGDKLFLPVENIELLTRFGGESAETPLDRLGGGAWQARKARMKNRIREIAEHLIKTAAARALKKGAVMDAPEGSYDEFCARFPYDETEDQLNAIESIGEDLQSGKPMDRLVCGDVGFGKTEVALRAAFMAAMSGKQVAVVVPTTLLARQHFKTFSERFKGFPLVVRQASRFVSQKEMKATKDGLKEGTVDIVVGTHALLAKTVSFKDLGLLIIDEEQHFGVSHKERLKEIKTDVHVLTLSATPIPRTLQLALTGVRELSLIATPPVDRLAVRTFISPFDQLIIREALLREHFRGGQSFYVCPRVSDLSDVKSFLEDAVPEVKVALAHGQMAAGELEDIMTAFYEGKFDVLLSTTIVESGLDIPTANTLIVHRADMFGLAQLYQLRGRVGRSKTRAYALFTVPANKTLTPAANRRLQVLQSLETLGAGFQLASHDMDIRGAGNLLGDEQSGHIKEVGFELYQQMLEEAIANLNAGHEDAMIEDTWSPQITLGISVMIPENYVPDLQLRMQLYRKIAELSDIEEINAFGADMVDRFGSIPEEVEALLKLVYMKSLCKKANIEKVDAGPKGCVITLRDNTFPNPAGLVGYIAKESALVKIRPDHKIVVQRDWRDDDARVKGVTILLTKLMRLAIEEKAAA